MRDQTTTLFLYSCSRFLLTVRPSLLSFRSLCVDWPSYTTLTRADGGVGCLVVVCLGREDALVAHLARLADVLLPLHLVSPER